MKLDLLARVKKDDAVLIASFGDARLVKKLTGKFELRGGSPADRAAAQKWCSLFMPDAVFAWAPSSLQPATSRPMQPRSA